MEPEIAKNFIDISHRRGCIGNSSVASMLSCLWLETPFGMYTRSITKINFVGFSPNVSDKGDYHMHAI